MIHFAMKRIQSLWCAFENWNWLQIIQINNSRNSPLRRAIDTRDEKFLDLFRNPSVIQESVFFIDFKTQIKS